MPVAHPRPSGPSWAVLLVVCVAQFLVLLDGLVATVALPAIDADLHLGAAGLPWVVDAYTLTGAGFVLLGGRLSDLVGRRTMFLAALALFLLTSLAAALAAGPVMLIVARAVQGLACAALTPVTLAIVFATYAEGPARSRAFAVWSSVASIGGAAGALVGGTLTEFAGWRWIFLVNLPVGLAVLALARRVLPGSAGTASRRLDVTGAVLVTAGLTGIVYGVVAVGRYGWGAPRVLIALVLGAVLVAVFVVHQNRWTPRPLVPFEIFRLGRVGLANGVMFLLGAGFFGSYYLLSLYLQQALHYGPLAAGLSFLPPTVAIAAGAQVSGRLVGRFGVRPPAVTGAALAAVGFALLGRVSDTSTYLGSLVLPIVLFSFGIGLAFTPITVAATSGVDPGRAGLASGVLNTTRQVTGTLAVAVLATVDTAVAARLVAGGTPDAAARAGGAGAAFVVAAGCAAAAALLALRLDPNAGRAVRTPAGRAAAPGGRGRSGAGDRPQART